MKAFVLLFLALPLLAEEPEGTDWYDAEGNLVRVEGPDAKPAETPFVAEWRKREIDRRERSRGHWSSEMWPVWNRGYRVRYGTYPAYRGRSYYRGGIYRHRGYHRRFRSLRGGGSRVIIRW